MHLREYFDPVLRQPRRWMHRFPMPPTEPGFAKLRQCLRLAALGFGRDDGVPSWPFSRLATRRFRRMFVDSKRVPLPIMALCHTRHPQNWIQLRMARLKSIDASHFRIPLDVPASDSTHGVDDVVRADHRARHRRRRPGGRRLHLHHRPQRRRHPSPSGPGDSRGRGRRRLRADRGGLAEGLVGAALWRPRRRGRARPLGARHGAVGPQGAAGEPAALPPARRPRCQGAVLRRRHRPRPLGQGSAGADRRQPGEGLSRHQDQGRPRYAAGGCRAHPRHAQASGRRLPADGRRQHEVVRRRGDPPRAGAAGLRSGVARGADHPGRRRGPREDPARRRAAGRDRRELPHPVGVPADDLGRRRRAIPSRTSPTAAASRSS